MFQQKIKSMRKQFVLSDVKSINESVIKMIGSDWMLLSAGTVDDYNIMTANWGSLGVLWNKPVATVFVRPQRHTYSYLEKGNLFTLNFLDSKHNNILNFCGTKSGKDHDKVAETGLKPMVGPHNTLHFYQSKLVLVCKKIYFDDINPDNFVDPDIKKNYVLGDYHRMFIGEITDVLVKKTNFRAE